MLYFSNKYDFYEENRFPNKYSTKKTPFFETEDSLTLPVNRLCFQSCSFSVDKMRSEESISDLNYCFCTRFDRFKLNEVFYLYHISTDTI